MERVYTRKHAHMHGSITAIVTEEAPQRYKIALEVLHPDGRGLFIAVGGTTYPTLAEAHEHAGDSYLNFMGSAGRR